MGETVTTWNHLSTTSAKEVVPLKTRSSSVVSPPSPPELPFLYKEFLGEVGGGGTGEVARKNWALKGNGGYRWFRW
jgi:hypothetical protein